MGAGLLKAKLDPEMQKKVHIISAGTYAMPGLPASANAQSVAREFDVNLSDHNSQTLTPYLISHSDLILVMSPEHAEIVYQMDPTSQIRTFLLKEFGRSSRNADEDAEVYDPIGGDTNLYHQVYQELDAEITRIIPSIARVVERVG
jgi:protein-tyrosine-phosphatase